MYTRPLNKIYIKSIINVFIIRHIKIIITAHINYILLKIVIKQTYEKNFIRFTHILKIESIY